MKKLLLILFILITLAGFSQMNEYKIRANMYLITDSLFVIGTDTLSGTTQIDRTDTIFVTLDYLEENFVDFTDDISHYQLDEPEIETSDSLIFYMHDAEGYWRLGKGILDTSKVKGLQTFVENNSAEVSGIRGYIPKFGASGLTESMVFEAANKTIGIGTTITTEKLEVDGNIKGDTIKAVLDTTYADKTSWSEFVGGGGDLWTDNGSQLTATRGGVVVPFLNYSSYIQLTDATDPADNLYLSTAQNGYNRIGSSTMAGFIIQKGTNPRVGYQGRYGANQMLFPYSDGTNGQILATNGNGNMYWSDGGSSGYVLPMMSATTLGGGKIHGSQGGLMISGTGVLGVNSSKQLTAIPTGSDIISFWDVSTNSEKKNTITNILSLGGGGGSMVYPSGSGIPIVVNGSSWGTTITNNSSNWNTAYNDKINSLAVTGTTTKTITLTQQDGGTVSGTFTDLQGSGGSGGVSSITAGNGLTGTSTTGDVTLNLNAAGAYSLGGIKFGNYVNINGLNLNSSGDIWVDDSKLSAATPASSDIIGFYDVSAGFQKKTTIGDILSLGGGGGSMVYPSAGIAVSTGTAWGTSITNNSSNWNTAYGWGDHSTKGYLTDSPSNGSLYGRKNGAWTVISTGTSAVTSVVAGNLVDVSSTTGDVTVNVDLSEATSDNTFNAVDELIYVYGPTQKKGTVLGLQSYMQSNLSFGGATNLSTSYSSTNVAVNSDTGDDATINAATTSNAGVMSATDKTKLDLTTTANTTNTTSLDLSLRNHLKYTTSSSSATITISNPTDLKTGNIEVIYNYSNGTIITFQVPSTYDLHIAYNIYNATINNYTKSVLQKSLGKSVYSYYISGTNIYINGTQSYF